MNTASETEGNISGELDSVKDGLLYMATSDATTKSTNTVNTDALPALAGASGALSSAIESAVKATSAETGSGTGT